MRNFRKLAAGVAALTIAGVGLPAGAQTEPVDVTLTNPGGSRVIFVEDMAGNDLVTSGINFGTSRSVPFQVRVEDNAFARQSFSVSSTMTNLYLDGGTSADKIASSNVTLNRQVPLNIFDVEATVQPLVNTVTTVTDGATCTVLTAAGVPCTLSTTGVVGKVQDLIVPVNLSNLASLPLLPQANETGAFTNAEYGAGTAGAGDPAATGAPTPTSRMLISGAPVDTAAVLSGLNTTLDTATRAALVEDSAVRAALLAAYPALLGVATTVVDSLVASAVATAQDLIPAQILAQTGRYITLPKLDVVVPGTAAAGNYTGTLVVTAVQ